MKSLRSFAKIDSSSICIVCMAKHQDQYINFKGKRYLLQKRPYLGQLVGDCDSPESPDKKIRIKSGLSEQEELDVIIHELLHISDWSKDESWVEETATEISKILYKLGWRKQEIKKVKKKKK